MSIYAVHTDDGTPMNETAMCEQHLTLATDYYDSALRAEDRPDAIAWLRVEHPENNDTVCRECSLDAR